MENPNTSSVTQRAVDPRLPGDVAPPELTGKQPPPLIAVPLPNDKLYDVRPD